MDELELAGLTPVASKLVKPPRVAESVVQLECKLRGTHETKNAKGESTGRIMIGEVGHTIIWDGFFPPNPWHWASYCGPSQPAGTCLGACTP